MNPRSSLLLALCILSSVASAQVFTERAAPGQLNWSDVAMSADGTKLAATVFDGQLFVSTTSGATWTAQATAGTRNWTAIASSSDGLTLGALGSGDVQRGLFTTSFAWGGRNVSGRQRYWQGLAMSGNGARWIVVDEGAINSSDRTGGAIYTSADQGTIWTALAGAGARNWLRTAISSDGTKMLACESFGHVYRSDDTGATWRQLVIDSAEGKHFSDVVCSADAATIVVSTSHSAPQSQSGKIYVSSDGGTTWVLRTPPSEADDLQQWKDLAVSSDGNRLLAVSCPGYVYSSVNKGQTWTAHKTYTSGGQPASLKFSWNSIACSSNGLKIAACAPNQGIFTAE